MTLYNQLHPFIAFVLCYWLLWRNLKFKQFTLCNVLFLKLCTQSSGSAVHLWLPKTVSHLNTHTHLQPHSCQQLQFAHTLHLGNLINRPFTAQPLPYIGLFKRDSYHTMNTMCLIFSMKRRTNTVYKTCLSILWILMDLVTAAASVHRCLCVPACRCVLQSQV